MKKSYPKYTNFYTYNHSYQNFTDGDYITNWYRFTIKIYLIKVSIMLEILRIQLKV